MTHHDSNLPPAGWYEDPENPTGPYRWWDGSVWTDVFQTPTPAAPEPTAPTQPDNTTPTVQPGSPVVPTPPTPAGSNITTTPPTPGAQPNASFGQSASPAPSPSSHVTTPQSHGHSDAPSGFIPHRVDSADPAHTPNPVPGHGAIATQGVATFPTMGESLKAGFKNLGAHWKPLTTIVVLLVALPMLLQLAVLPAFLDFYIPAVTGDGEIKAGGAFVFSFVASLCAWFLLVVALLAAAALSLGADNNQNDRTSFGAAWPAIGVGFRRSFVYIGWYIAVAVGVSLLTMALSYLSVALGVAILVLLLTIILIVLAFLITVKWAFIPQAIVSGENVPFGPSARVSRGRFWRVLGQLIVASLVFTLVPSFLSNIVTVLMMSVSGSKTYTIPVETLVGIDEFNIVVPGATAGAISGLIVGLLFGFAVLGGLMGSLSRIYRSAPTT